ncbi:MAG: 4-hydroxy-tetrahydrodipicolinate synthase [Candidatus Vidania fulgoroideorum]
MLEGIITSLVTPMKSNGKLDYISLKKLINFQLNNKIKNILVLGSTGEPCTLNFSEHLKLVSKTVKYSKNKFNLVSGSCSNSTFDSIYINKRLEFLKVNYLLQVVPYYNRPSQNGIYNHFKSISLNTNLPIIIYNIPSRTGINIDKETIISLSKFDNIIGIKNSVNDIGFCFDLINYFRKNRNFYFYCGDDIYFLLFYLFGAKGNISVSSNIFPKEMNLIVRYLNNNNFRKSLNLYFKLFNIFKLLSFESNPIPVKWVLSKMNLIKNNLRLPLTTLGKTGRKLMKKELIKYNSNFFCF